MFNLTAIEIETALKKGEQFAETLAALARAFKTEYLQRSHQVLNDIEAFDTSHPRKLDFRQKRERRQILDRLKPGADTMWKVFLDAKLKEHGFYYTHDLFQPPIKPDTYLTEVLKQLMDLGRLRDTDAVAFGRPALGQLSQKTALFRFMGYDLEFGNKFIHSHAFREAEREYRRPL